MTARRHLQLAPRHSGPNPLARGAFTLVELLVVIAIIVIMLGLATAAFNVLTQSRSVAGAENQISAALARARSRALAVQKPTGVMFFIDRATRRTQMALVEVGTSNSTMNYLDLVPDEPLAPVTLGVGVQMVTGSDLAANPSPPPALIQTTNGYIGYVYINPSLNNGVGPVILFDSSGRLTSQNFGYLCSTASGATAMGNLIGGGTGPVSSSNPDNTGQPLQTGIGLVLYDEPTFNSKGYHETDDTPFASAEKEEEGWLNQNGVVLLINRYNGTFIQGDR